MRSLRIGLFMATILLLSLAIGCGGGGGGGGGGPVLGGISIIENISPGGKILAGTQYNLKVQPQGGTNWTFQWASNHSGDVFGTSTSKTTTYTPSSVTADTNVEITCNGVPDGGTAQVSKIQFIITKNTNPYIKVTRPNGGEEFFINTDEEISWNSQDVTGNVKIEYSPDNFVNTTVLTPNTANSGSWLWQNIPIDATDTARIRITSLNNTSISDESDANFKIIIAVLNLTQPDGIETWYKYETEEITWVSGLPAGTMLDIEYSNDDFLNDIEPIASNVLSETQYFDWKILVQPSITARVRIKNHANPSINDVSDDVFEVRANEVYIDSPAKDEVLWSNFTYEIKWHSDQNFGNVKIEAQYGDAVWHVLKSSTSNTGSWLWDPIPDEPTSLAQIKISNVDNPDVVKVSDQFTIKHSELVVDAPISSEKVTSQTAYEIKWHCTHNFGQVKIEANYGDGNGWHELVPATDNDGTWIWDPVPSINTSQAQIKISFVNAPNIEGVSGLFEICVPAIYITNPCENDLFCTIYSINIVWNSEFLSPTGKVKIDYYVGGSFVQHIAENTENDGYYLWDASKNNPNPSSALEKAFIRITSNDVPSVSDDSGLFDYLNPYIHQIRPFFWEQITLDKDYQIKWESLGVDTAIITIVDETTTLKFVGNKYGEWPCDDPQHDKIYSVLWHVGDAYPSDLYGGIFYDFCFTMYWRWIYNPNVFDTVDFYIGY